MSGIIVDNFACGGGASEGIENALGRPVDHAINHNAKALAMHMANHPRTRHWHENIRNLNPLRVGPGSPVELGWFSPDCTWFSKARGGKPFRDPRRAMRVRGLASSVTWWARLRRPKIIMLENVSEFVHWGPLLPDGRPDAVRRGQSFRRWHKRLENLGYRVDMRELVACDYGAPTSRKRLFVIARCDGGEIIFPERAYGPGLMAYRAAAECFDWSIPCTSIFEREALGKKPLVDPTLRRIARGVWRYVIHDPHPFIAPIPLSGNDHSLAVAALINTRNGERHGRHGEQAPRVRDIRVPYPTITAQGSQGALVLAFLARNYGGHENDGSSLHRPMHAVTAKDHHAVVAAFLTRYNGASGPQPLNQPLTTIDTTDRFGLVTVHIQGAPHRIVDVRTRMPEPRELARAQSFRDGYILDPSFKGKPLSKADQVSMIGNSVPPVVAEALVRANLVEQREEVAA